MTARSTVVTNIHNLPFRKEMISNSKPSEVTFSKVMSNKFSWYTASSSWT
eukprot:CAMPEP_0115732160 /NCGR_PEP_ID=MMETSP0272-20121206/84975_1 /TAXON_ID=71861 /ORGANISM="Scrippsiella trochoidea, Strain CCMP3099" /LENGTH=49 /DNA_ID= /DNA_START= /DNA_END= /DNA_ORIENTATION=